MTAAISVQNVILAPADLRLRRSPWAAINRRMGFAWLALFLGVWASLLFVGFRLDPGFFEVVVMVALIVIGVLAFCWLMASAQTTASKAYAHSRVGSEPCQWNFSDAGVQQLSPSIQTSFPWTSVVEVIETETAFQFVLTPFVAGALPKRFMEEAQITSLRDLVQSQRERGAITGINA